jgi:hexokinase
MALAAETRSIVAQYDYTDEDVNLGVKEFLRQMGKSPNHTPI